MKVILASEAGFCSGIKLAIKKTEELLKNKDEVYAIEPILHNKSEMAKLIFLGLKELKDELKEGSSLILPAHGTTDVEKNTLKKLKIKIFDLVCPYVRFAAEIVNKIKDEDAILIILGDREHREVEYLKSFADKEKSFVISNIQELYKINFTKRNVNLVVQTTQDPQFVEDVLKYLKEKSFLKIKYYNTLCKEVTDRFVKAKDIAKKVDLMLIVGDKESANTKRMFEVVKRENLNSFHIETYKDINARSLKGIKTVGICAGTSTPSWVIQEIINYLEGSNDA